MLRLRLRSRLRFLFAFCVCAQLRPCAPAAGSAGRRMPIESGGKRRRRWFWWQRGRCRPRNNRFVFGVGQGTGVLFTVSVEETAFCFRDRSNKNKNRSSCAVGSGGLETAWKRLEAPEEVLGEAFEKDFWRALGRSSCSSGFPHRRHDVCIRLKRLDRARRRNGRSGTGRPPRRPQCGGTLP